MTLWETISYPFRRRPRRPLAARRPDRREMGQVSDVPLGMEATDMELVKRVNRRNDALERANLTGRSGRQEKGSFTAAVSLDVDPMPEDETYAARFHRAFLTKGK